MKESDPSAGFTLLELVISLTIIAIIAVMVQNGFKLSVSAWEKGKASVEEQQRYRYVLDLMQGQVASALPLSFGEKDKSGGNEIFKGDEASLEFALRTSRVPGTSGGMVRVQYRVETEDDKKSLWFTEMRLIDRLRGSSQGEPGEEDWHMLLSHVYELEFEYLSNLPSGDILDEASSWEPSWGESEEQTGLPLALRIRFQADMTSPPLYLVIPVGKGKV